MFIKTYLNVMPMFVAIDADIYASTSTVCILETWFREVAKPFVIRGSGMKILSLLLYDHRKRIVDWR